MTEPQFQQTKLSKIMTLGAYNRLQDWINKNNKTPYPPDVKQFFNQAPGREYYSKQLEKIIIRLINRTEGIAVKVKNTGRYMDKTKQVTDVVGRVRVVGSKGFVRDANVIKGMADIRADISGGKTWYIEVKIDDKQSDYQKEFEHLITNIGHHYSIVRTVDDFFQQYKQLTGKEII
jgi:hypothetical protein